MEKKVRAGDTLLGQESDDEEVDTESEDEHDEEEEEAEKEPVAKKTKTEKFVPQPRAVKEARRDKKEQPENEIQDAEKKLAEKAITNKKRKRLLERIKQVF